MYETYGARQLHIINQSYLCAWDSRVADIAYAVRIGMAAKNDAFENAYRAIKGRHRASEIDTNIESISEAEIRSRPVPTRTDTSEEGWVNLDG